MEVLYDPPIISFWFFSFVLVSLFVRHELLALNMYVRPSLMSSIYMESKDGLPWWQGFIDFMIKIGVWGAVSSNVSNFFSENIDMFLTFRHYTLAICK